MSEIRLSGRLVCADQAEVALVEKRLPRHVALTRAEQGCLEFSVTRSADPSSWDVRERFADEPAFRAHQRRVAASEWGRATSGISRRYTVDGLAD